MRKIYEQKTHLAGAYFRAMRVRKGPCQAIEVTAHKIAQRIYHLLKTGEPYQEESVTEYEQKRWERELKRLQRQTHKRGFSLAPVPATAPESQPKGSRNGSF